mmetsp:Transcript_14448/g.32161  ORF Transcript_14448/g.32161 Transcript_14448/m.32161 type:complete len:619 (-) Transcript_14448:121-1977(-)
MGAAVSAEVVDRCSGDAVARHDAARDKIRAGGGRPVRPESRGHGGGPALASTLQGVPMPPPVWAPGPAAESRAMTVPPTISAGMGGYASPGGGSPIQHPDAASPPTRTVLGPPGAPGMGGQPPPRDSGLGARGDQAPPTSSYAPPGQSTLPSGVAGALWPPVSGQQSQQSQESMMLPPPPPQHSVATWPPSPPSAPQRTEPWGPLAEPPRLPRPPSSPVGGCKAHDPARSSSPKGQGPRERPAAPGRGGASPLPDSDIVTLNIGGEKIVQRRRSTLCAAKGSLLASLLSGDTQAALVWRYVPADGKMIGVRAVPAIEGGKTGHTLRPGEMFSVSQQYRSADGILYLKLADGRGWIFETKPGVGKLCVPEVEKDRDDQGRIFINYSPEIFMPLLDYLGMKEKEDPEHPAPLPKGPDHARPQFEAMLRSFGLLPGVTPGGAGAAFASGTRELDTTLTQGMMPYAAASWWSYGLAFEVRAKGRIISVTALETCAVTKDEHSYIGGVRCTVHQCEGPLGERLSQRTAWVEAGAGTLYHRRASRIEFPYPVLVQGDNTRCFYIATDTVGSGSGVAFGAPAAPGLATQNEDLEIYTGHFSTRFDDFSDGPWYPFNGKVEYVVLG